MTDNRTLPAGAIVLSAEQGRTDEMGFVRAVFKADGEETQERYSVSEWWMEPRKTGPGAQSHADNDEMFYVLEGTASILIGDQWINVGRGSFIRIPAGVTHDFENRTDKCMGLLNFFIPGGFEKNMPATVEWFERNRERRCSRMIRARSGVNVHANLLKARDPAGQLFEFRGQ